MNKRNLTYIDNSNQVGALLSKCYHLWVVEYFFRQVQSKFAESEAWEAAASIAADGKVVKERAASVFGAIVRFADSGGGVGIEIVDEMGKATIIGGYIIRRANPKA